MLELSNFNVFSDINNLSKLVLILICVFSSLITIWFMLNYGLKTSYKMNFNDWAIAIIASLIACAIFPIIGNGGWNWYVITGVATGMVFLKSIRHLI